MKRRWFQIHLSTAIVLMLVAGGLLGLNFIQTRPVSYIVNYDASGPTFDPIIAVHQVKGWPIAFEQPKVNFFSSESMDLNGGGPVQLPIEVFEVSLTPVFLNLATGLIILLAVAAMCELAVRRRQRKRLLQQ